VQRRRQLLDPRPELGLAQPCLPIARPGSPHRMCVRALPARSLIFALMPSPSANFAACHPGRNVGRIKRSVMRRAEGSSFAPVHRRITAIAYPPYATAHPRGPTARPWACLPPW
jgi:hypothetical protein